MLFGVHEIQKWDVAYQEKDGNYYPARPLWTPWGRWKHAWWVLILRAAERQDRCTLLWRQIWQSVVYRFRRGR